MSLTPGKKLFQVTIERTITETADLYVEGDSEEEVRAAVEADDLDNNYFWDNHTPDYDVHVWPTSLDKIPQTEDVRYGVIDGKVYEIDDEEYQNALETGNPCPVDTLTLPLPFPDDEEKK